MNFISRLFGPLGGPLHVWVDTRPGPVKFPESYPNTPKKLERMLKRQGHGKERINQIVEFAFPNKRGEHE